MRSGRLTFLAPAAPQPPSWGWTQTQRARPGAAPRWKPARSLPRRGLPEVLLPESRAKTLPWPGAGEGRKAAGGLRSTHDHPGDQLYADARFFRRHRARWRVAV